MSLYMGVDFHPHQQTVAWCDTRDGEIRFRTFKHSDKEALKAFYKGLKEPAVIGVEATGGLDWFERMIFENGHEFLVGHPHKIRRRALSRHKNDRRDAETMLDLLMNGEFPELWRRNEGDRATLSLLNFRQHMVGQRTSVANQLQALARKAGLARFQVKTKSGRSILLKAELSETDSYLRERLIVLFDDLSGQIDQSEDRLDEVFAENEAAQKLATHPGVGRLTALTVAATLGDVSRFNNTRQAVSFVGLDPLDGSTGEKRRIGKISKHGSRLCRFMLGQAAAKSSDRRMRSSYSQIRSRRGHAIAKVAIARRLLVNCYVMLRDNIDYAEFCRRGAKVGLHGEPLAPDTSDCSFRDGAASHLG